MDLVHTLSGSVILGTFRCIWNRIPSFDTRDLLFLLEAIDALDANSDHFLIPFTGPLLAASPSWLLSHCDLIMSPKIHALKRHVGR